MSTKKTQKDLPLFFIFGMASIPMVFFIGMGIGILMTIGENLADWVTAFATVAIALLTTVLAIETWRLRDAQIKQVNKLRQESIRPNVSITLIKNRADLQLRDIEVANLGKGIARNIKFKFFNREQKEMGKGDSPVIDALLDINILKEGIITLGIGQKIESYAFSFHDIAQKIGQDNIFSPTFQIEFTYEDVEGWSYKNSHFVDFSEYKGIKMVGHYDPVYEMSNNLEKLNKSMEVLSKAFQNRLDVNTHTAQDRIEEKKNQAKIREQQQKKVEQAFLNLAIKAEK